VGYGSARAPGTHVKLGGADTATSTRAAGRRSGARDDAGSPGVWHASPLFCHVVGVVVGHGVEGNIGQRAVQRPPSTMNACQVLDARYW
jgi:hypothetical protein